MVRSTTVWRDHSDLAGGSVWLENYNQREQQALPLVLEPDDAVLRPRPGIHNIESMGAGFWILGVRTQVS